MARVKELSRQQIAEYLLTGEFDPLLENKLRRLQDEDLKITDILKADFSGIYQELDNREVSASN